MLQVDDCSDQGHKSSPAMLVFTSPHASPRDGPNCMETTRAFKDAMSHVGPGGARLPCTACVPLKRDSMGIHQVHVHTHATAVMQCAGHRCPCDALQCMDLRHSRHSGRSPSHMLLADSRTLFLRYLQDQPGPLKHNTEELHSMLQRVSSSEDLLELSSLQLLPSRQGQPLAARQAEILESVSQELLCSPEIIRCNLVAAWCLTTDKSDLNSQESAVSWCCGTQAATCFRSTCSLGTYRQGEMAQWLPQKQH